MNKKVDERKKDFYKRIGALVTEVVNSLGGVYCVCENVEGHYPNQIYRWCHGNFKQDVWAIAEFFCKTGNYEAVNELSDLIQKEFMSLCKNNS